MGFFKRTPSDSTLDKTAYCVLYEIIKEGVSDSNELREVLEYQMSGGIDTDVNITLEEKESLKPIYRRAYEIAITNSFEKVKKLVSQVATENSPEY